MTPCATCARRATWRSGLAVTGSPQAPGCSWPSWPCCGAAWRRPGGLLEEALERSLAARNTPFVTLCLVAYARLAFADGDPERAARLEGAAEGLRRRVGLRAWPALRPVEADLVAQVRPRLGDSQFDQVFSAGSRLTQREAVAIVWDQRGTGTPAP